MIRLDRSGRPCPRPRRIFTATLAGLWLAAPGGLRAQDPVERGPSVFSSDTGVVLLDVIVRDKKGRLVRDLKTAEIQVLEDGVKQEVTAFRLVATAPPLTSTIPASPIESATPPESEPKVPAQVSLCTLLFDQLGPAGRELSRRAALEFLDLPQPPGQYVSVFAIGNRLQLVQQFTQDREALKKAVATATNALAPALSQDSERADRMSKQELDIMIGLEALAASAGPSPTQSAAAAAAGQQAAILRMAVDAIRFTDSLQRQQQGEASLFALIGLARQQQRLAGRKTIVYFSEGLRTTSALEQTYRSAISEANRANVSIYAVDARGLTTGSGYTTGQDMTKRAVEAVRRQMTSRGTAAVTREEALAGETVEESLRANTQDTLGDLAEGTGGFLIANTNNLKSGLERMAGDVSGYYEVVYAPRKLTYDGAFRKVEVKVGRSGLSVQARSGYFAMPPGEGSVTFPYELALLAALKADPVAQDFAYRSAAFRFDQAAAGSVYSVGLEVPIEHIKFRKEGDHLEGHFRIMAVLRSPTRGIVEKAVQDSPLQVPADRYDALRRGQIFFTRTFRLEPGRYTLETVVADEQGKKTSVRKSALNVPAGRPALGLSSLTVVKKTEPVTTGALDTDDPFRFGATRIVPYVGEPTLVKGDDVSLFFVAYPEAGAGALPELLLEFMQEGAIVARSNPALPTADENGRIPFIATVPSAGFASGRIEVRAVLRQGSRTAEGRAFFSIGG